MGSRIKKSNFIYPTLDTLQRNYPKLYPVNALLCKECNIDIATNTHIGLCHKHINKISSLMEKHKPLLFAIINKHATGLTFDLQRVSFIQIGIKSLNTPYEDFSILSFNPSSNSNGINIFSVQYIGRKCARDSAFAEFINE
ncbi:unnamed protein product [Rhizophagus irregularis]|nr:unnamed protein product [Rhizophagus irregularis]